MSAKTLIIIPFQYHGTKGTNSLLVQAFCIRLVSANEIQKSGHGSKKNITLRTEEAPLRKLGLVYLEA
jgi:hypothetical protein